MVFRSDIVGALGRGLKSNSSSTTAVLYSQIQHELVQAAIDGVWSSRKIDKLAHEKVVYMYLVGTSRRTALITISCLIKMEEK